MRMPLLILLSILFISGCASSTLPHVPSKWVQTDAREFSFLAPLDIKQIPYQGIDSFVGAYEGRSIYLHFDYGLYSDPLEKYEFEISGVSNFSSKETVINGEQARVVSYYSQKENPFHYQTAVHFPATKSRQKLTFSASCKTEKDLKTASKILQTIRFKESKTK
jgi:hypothetical protein